MAPAYAAVPNRRAARSERLPVPVVIVGNLIAGGAGKTPAVRAVIDILRAHGRRPGIVSRGYGRRDAGIVEVEPDEQRRAVGDEPLLLRLRSGVPVVVGATGRRCTRAAAPASARST